MFMPVTAEFAPPEVMVRTSLYCSEFKVEPDAGNEIPEARTPEVPKAAAALAEPIAKAVAPVPTMKR